MASNFNMESNDDDIQPDAVPFDNPEYVASGDDRIKCIPKEKKTSLLPLDVSQYILKYFDDLSPDLKVDNHDVMVFYHEANQKNAETFKEHLCKIKLKNGNFLRAALHDDPEFMSLAGAEFENLEDVFERCIFAFILLSDHFVKDSFCKIISQSFLRTMIDSEEKKWCVVPVITAKRNKLKFKIPLELRALKELKFFEPFDCFDKCVQSLLDGRSSIRKEKEKTLMEDRISYLKSKGLTYLENESVSELDGLPKLDTLSERPSIANEHLQLNGAVKEGIVEERSSSQNDNKTDATRASQNSTSKGEDCLHTEQNLQNEQRSPQRTNLQVSNVNGCCDKSTKDQSRSDETDLETDGSVLKTNDNHGQSQSNFVKKYDDMESVRNMRLASNAAHSVGIVRTSNGSGTGFRVGTKYLATARHVIAEKDGQVNKKKLTSTRFFVQFEYLMENEASKENSIFYFTSIAYENIVLDTLIIELKIEVGKTLPLPIAMISEINIDNPISIIGHPTARPQMIDPKCYIYTYSKEDVEKSTNWAISNGISAENAYKDIDNKDKVLFHCASQKGASGALGIMVDNHFDEPQSVIMLLKGYPSFYYGNLSFTDKDKEEFLIVEQGVKLSAVYEDMKRQEKYNDLVNDIVSTLKNPTEDEANS